MAEKSERLSELIAAIADGDVVDWQALGEDVATEELRRALFHLRIVAGVAEVHRSPTVNDVPLATDEAHAVSPSSRKSTVGVGLEGHAAARDPERWGHFLLVEKIGEGTFGEVFHARDTWLDHAVALKLLKPELADLSRLLHEARTLAQIRHQHVVRVYGADKHEGRVGFWMEFIRGNTLADVIAREGVRSGNEAAVIGQDLCRALAAVHGKDIVHRDVKARNVMRESDTGRIVLMDFGAGELMKARVFGQLIAGTPLYLAPELFDGSLATPQTDIYALGVLLFHLATGGFPVQGASLEDLMAAHERGERRRLDDVRPDLPDTFVRAVETMLARDPAARYPTAASARAALEAVVTSRPAAPIVPVPHEWSGGTTPGIASDQSRQAAEAGWHSRVLNALSVIAVALIILTFAGFATSTFYDRALGLTEGFDPESPLSWPMWGLRALLAAALVMAGAVMVWTLLKILCRLLLAPRPVRRWCDRIIAGVHRKMEPVRSAEIATVASVVLLAQIAVVVVFVWRFQALLGGLDGFIYQKSPTNLALLGPQNRAEQILFDVTLCVQVLIFGLMWHWLFRRRSLPRQPDATGLVVVGMTIAALSLLVFKIVPFRILYHNDAELVSYELQRCYLVAQRGDEARLFCPLQPPPWKRVLRIDDPALKREGITENIFTGLNRSF